MCICKVVQLLLGLQIEHLDGLVRRPRNDEPVVARHRNWVYCCLWKRMSGGVEERKERMMVLVCASAKWCSCCLVCRSNTLMDLSSDPETMNLLSLDTATDQYSVYERGWVSGVEERKERMMVPWCASAKWCSCCLVCRSNTLMDLSQDPETMNLLSLDTATEVTVPYERGWVAG